MCIQRSATYVVRPSRRILPDQDLTSRPVEAQTADQTGNLSPSQIQLPTARFETVSPAKPYLQYEMPNPRFSIVKPRELADAGDQCESMHTELPGLQ